MPRRAQAAIIVPTRSRPGYLAVTLASIAPQAKQANTKVIVVDDSDLIANERVAEHYGAQYIAHAEPQGPNAARNTGIAATDTELIILVDDDICAPDGWLTALLAAAQADQNYDVFGGPIRARLEDSHLHLCGREAPPITTLELGEQNCDAEFVWSANMLIRRRALQRTGPFNSELEIYGDEEEWQRRYKSEGGLIRYIAGAGLEHRRSGKDARLPSLVRAGFLRGRHSRRFDQFKGSEPSLSHELKTFLGCVGHTIRYRCAGGIVMSAHSLGRLIEATDRSKQTQPKAEQDFLSGHNGAINVPRAVFYDLLLDGYSHLKRESKYLDRLTKTMPKQSVLVLAVSQPEQVNLLEAAVAELQRSKHKVDVAIKPIEGKGKFENLTELLQNKSLTNYDWLLLIDDDVALPVNFLNRFLFLAKRFELKLAQPAHRRNSHAAWPLTKRQLGSLVRETQFVEIGPLTAIHFDAFSVFLPFPQLRMGWGLDAHWSALAQQHGLKQGIVDATAIGHKSRPIARSYSSTEAIAEAKAFLADRPYLNTDQSQRTLVMHKSLEDLPQAWFWTTEWRRKEQEAQDDITAGRVTRYENSDDFIDSLEDPNSC